MGFPLPMGCLWRLATASFGYLSLNLGTSGRGRDLTSVPTVILFVPSIPKTRNLKIMRRVVRAAHLDENPGVCHRWSAPSHSTRSGAGARQPSTLATLFSLQDLSIMTHALQGRRALVTGLRASAAIALALAQEGCHLVLHGLGSAALQENTTGGSGGWREHQRPSTRTM